MKLVRSCRLRCACFSSALERALAGWPWGRAGEDRPLVPGAPGPWVPVLLAVGSGEGHVPSEKTGFRGGLWCTGGLEPLCPRVPSGLGRAASSAPSGVPGRRVALPFPWRLSSERSEAGEASWLGVKLASN